MQKSTGSYVSCCVVISGVERNLFVLPRQKKLDGTVYPKEKAHYNIL
jgi:hypothetical protein